MAGTKKLSDEEREEIRRLNKEEGLSYSALAVRYDVNYRTIQRVCNPEKYEVQKEANNESRKKNQQNIYNHRKVNMRRFSLLLARSVDGKMIDHLEAQKNVNGYLKSIIRKDMEATLPPPNSEKDR